MKIEGDDTEKDAITDIPIGTSFTALDTRVEYIWSGSAWTGLRLIEPPAWSREYFFDDATGWTVNAPYTIAGGALNFIADRPSAFAFSDVLGTTFDNTAWVQRCIYNVTTISTTSSPNISAPIGLNSNSGNGDTLKNYLGLGARNQASNTDWQAYHCDNQILSSGAVPLLGGTPVVETRYNQIIRRSISLCDYQVFIDSDFTNVDVESLGFDIGANITDLRFAWIGGRSSAGSPNGTLEGNIDVLQYADGTTNPP